MRLKPSLRNLAKIGLKFFLLAFLLSGCSSSTSPSYIREDIDQAIQDICKKEYKIDVKVTSIDSTLWIYLPLENIIETPKKPEKYVERFQIDEVNTNLNLSSLNCSYSIRVIPEIEKLQQVSYNKEAKEKINYVWMVLRRVLFSMDNSKQNIPQFFSLVTADIKNGFSITETFYLLDFKKVNYGFISWPEYQHRALQDTSISEEIIGDSEGKHVLYKDINMKDFIIEQIKQRIELKFQKPEVERNVDIDKEIVRVVITTFKIYNFKDFNGVELNNKLTNKKILLNRAAIWAHPGE
jgi:hypothetical protein